MRLGLSSVSGGGKTYSALLIAYGMCKDWSKIAIIDSENNSADLYAHLGSFNVLPLTAPFSPERYIEAIK
ncbi:MAG: AAA family ATPase, partial [Flavisolibacter sp.]|nr:AAA family ATPase [Flavisolibacter sp.]